MSVRKSILMMTNTGTNWNLVGEPVRADAYYGYTDGIHTVQLIYQNFIGGFGLQGTLAINPQPEDWFWINIGCGCEDPFIKFPQNPYSPTGENGGDTGSYATTFIGNFVYLRAVISRDYISPTSPGDNWQTWTYGQVDKVLLSL